MNQLRVAVSAVAVTVAIALISAAGCGGGDSDETTAGTDAQVAGQTNGESTTQSGESTGEASEPGGEGQESGGESASGSPRAVFIEEADEICEEARKRTSREFSELEEEGTAQGFSRDTYDEIIDKVITPRLEERIRGIQALDTPASAEEAAEVVVAGFEEVLEVTKGVNSSEFDAAVNPVLSKTRAATARQGFAGCSRFLG